VLELVVLLALDEWLWEDLLFDLGSVDEAGCEEANFVTLGQVEPRGQGGDHVDGSSLVD
jgi:hypothetical protein